MASSSLPSPTLSYETHLPLLPSSLSHQGEKCVVAEGTRVPIHIVTTASQLPAEFLEPSPQTELVVGFDTEGAELCRIGALCVMQVFFSNDFVRCVWRILIKRR